jgi:IS5 family transposase
VKQQSLASHAVFEKYGRKSRRELFVDEMEQVVPWSGLQSLVEPHYAKAGNGRRPVGLGIMLRTYFVQQWFNLSDPGVEEALYESAALRRFVGVDLGAAPAPDETTFCRFRHLLEKHDLGGLMLEAVKVHLEAKGTRAKRARIVPMSCPGQTSADGGQRSSIWSYLLVSANDFMRGSILSSCAVRNVHSTACSNMMLFRTCLIHG